MEGILLLTEIMLGPNLRKPKLLPPAPIIKSPVVLQPTENRNDMYIYKQQFLIPIGTTLLLLLSIVIQFTYFVSTSRYQAFPQT